jgi:hypothetical protein
MIKFLSDAIMFILAFIGLMAILVLACLFFGIPKETIRTVTRWILAIKFFIPVAALAAPAIFIAIRRFIKND